MLFHVTHIHTADNCPYDKPEEVKATWGKVFANTNPDGVKVLSGYIDPLAHAFYFVLDAEGADKIEQFLAPVIASGEITASPVTDYKDILARRSK
jgi:hypothetical protein